MRDKLVELLQGMHNATCDAAVGWLDSASSSYADQLNVEADYLIEHGVGLIPYAPQNEELEKLGYLKASKCEHGRRIIDADKFCMYLADVQLANRGVHDHICDFIDDVLWAIDEERFIVHPKEEEHD